MTDRAYDELLLTSPDTDSTAPVLAGDHKDDDGQVLDSFFVETDASPTPPTESITQPSAEPVTPTRVISQTFTLRATASEPFQATTPDPNRVSMTIGVNSTTAGDFVRWADNKAGCQGPDPINNPTLVPSAAKVYSTNPVTLPHTGAVFFAVPAADIEVSLTLVTR